MPTPRSAPPGPRRKATPRTLQSLIDRAMERYPDGLPTIETCGECDECARGELPEPGFRCAGLGGGAARP